MFNALRTPLLATAAACAALAIAGCSGGGSAPTMSAPPTANGPLSKRIAPPGAPRQFLEAFHPLSAGSPARHAKRGGGWLSPQAAGGSGLLYVGDFGASVVTIYPRRGVNPSPIGQITDGISSPERLFVDANGSLYASVVNAVTVYAKGTTSPSLTITNGISGPTGVTVDSAGTVYVSNTGTSTVTEYPAGATSPSVTLAIPGTPEDLCVDSQGNLYVGGFFGSSGGVLEFAPGSSTGTNLGIVVGDAGGIEVDRNGNLALDDLFGDAINLYNPGQTQPYRVISLDGLPFELAMNKKQGQLYASVLVGSSFNIERVGYPDKNPTAKLDNAGGAAWPVAVSPDNVQ
ncbi:MAG: hypothetical protein ABI202_08850 [Candidatus Baltobacteraceae bacterium]